MSRPKSRAERDPPFVHVGTPSKSPMLPCNAASTIAAAARHRLTYAKADPDTAGTRLSLDVYLGRIKT